MSEGSLPLQNQFFQNVLAIWCVILTIASIVLVSSNGWHAGFLTAQTISTQLPAGLWEALNTLGDERMLLALMLPFCMRYPRVFWAIVVASILGALLAKGVKFAIPLPRPAEILDASQLTIIGGRRTGHSFPSSHATSIFAFAMVCIASVPRRLVIPILGLAVLASFSRVAAGAHWPIDILAGAMLGSLSAWAGLVLARHLSWGCDKKIHWFLVSVVALSVCSLPFDSQGFPGSLAFRCVVCCIGITAFYLHYLKPLIGQCWTFLSTQARPA